MAKNMTTCARIYKKAIKRGFVDNMYRFRSHVIDKAIVSLAICVGSYRPVLRVGNAKRAQTANSLSPLGILFRLDPNATE